MSFAEFRVRDINIFGGHDIISDIVYVYAMRFLSDWKPGLRQRMLQMLGRGADLGQSSP